MTHCLNHRINITVLVGPGLVAPGIVGIARVVVWIDSIGIPRIIENLHNPVHVRDTFVRKDFHKFVFTADDVAEMDHENLLSLSKILYLVVYLGGRIIACFREAAETQKETN